MTDGETVMDLCPKCSAALAKTIEKFVKAAYQAGVDGEKLEIRSV